MSSRCGNCSDSRGVCHCCHRCLHKYWCRWLWYRYCGGQNRGRDGCHGYECYDGGSSLPHSSVHSLCNLLVKSSFNASEPLVPLLLGTLDQPIDFPQLIVDMTKVAGDALGEFV